MPDPRPFPRSLTQKECNSLVDNVAHWQHPRKELRYRYLEHRGYMMATTDLVTIASLLLQELDNLHLRPEIHMEAVRPYHKGHGRVIMWYSSTGSVSEPFRLQNLHELHGAIIRSSLLALDQRRIVMSGEDQTP